MPRRGPVTAQGVDGVLADFVGGHGGHESRRVAVIGQGHGDVGFAAAVGGLEFGGLGETQIPFGVQPQHDFTEAYDFHETCTAFAFFRWEEGESPNPTKLTIFGKKTSFPAGGSNFPWKR